MSLEPCCVAALRELLLFLICVSVVRWFGWGQGAPAIAAPKGGRGLPGAASDEGSCASFRETNVPCSRHRQLSCSAGERGGAQQHTQRAAAALPPHSRPLPRCHSVRGSSKRTASFNAPALPVSCR